MVDDSVWRRRLLTYSLIRAIGLVIFFLGIAIIYTNLLRQGGWPRAGAIIAIIGVIDGLLMPHFVKRSWERRDRGEM